VCGGSGGRGEGEVGDDARAAISDAIGGEHGAARLGLRVLVQNLICKHKGLIPDSNVKACQPI
jgi:hypothetical protein